MAGGAPRIVPKRPSLVPLTGDHRYGVRAQLTAGMALVPFQFARKPNEVLALAARTPFQLTFETLTADPLWVKAPLQSWVIV